MSANARLRPLNERPAAEGRYVLYWMQQSQREAFNPALEAAVVSANRLRLPVLVGFGLTESYPQANARHYTFMLEGLRGVEHALARRGIGFAIRLGSPDDVALALARRAALVVCDRGYLRHQREWRRNVAENAGRRVLQVEGDAVGNVADGEGAKCGPIGGPQLRHVIAAEVHHPDAEAVEGHGDWE